MHGFIDMGLCGEQLNLPEYDQWMAPLDYWIVWMAFHKRQSRADSTLPSTVEMFGKEK